MYRREVIVAGFDSRFELARTIRLKADQDSAVVAADSAVIEQTDVGIGTDNAQEISQGTGSLRKDDLVEVFVAHLAACAAYHPTDMNFRDIVI